jgi:hypothetical protein
MSTVGQITAEDQSLPPIREDCLVCTSSARSVVASMLELGATPKEIAEATGLDVGELAKHLTACIPMAPEAGDDQELQNLLLNSVETYHAATLQGNLVASTAALSVRLRALSELERRTQTRAEQRDDFASADPRRLETWPPALKNFVQVFCDSLVEQTTNETIQPAQNNYGRKDRQEHERGN